MEKKLFTFLQKRQYFIFLSVTSISLGLIWLFLSSSKQPFWETTAQEKDGGTIKKLTVLLPSQYRPQQIQVTENAVGQHILEGDIIIPESDVLSPAELQQFSLPILLDSLKNAIDFNSEGIQINWDAINKTASMFDTPDGALNAVAITGRYYRWKNATIPYRLEDNFSAAKVQTIQRAIQHINSRTNLTIVPYGGEQDYVAFIDRGGCWSNVGRIGGRQEISIGQNCSFSSTVHEICHAAGLWHEQSREDRDQHVQVLWQNIESSNKHNFEKHIADGMDIGRYDRNSVMHYPSYTFSRNGRPTIIGRDGSRIKQTNELSAGDIAAINTLYPNGTIVQPYRPNPTPNPTKPKPIKPYRPVANANKVVAAVNRWDGKTYLFNPQDYIRYNQNMPEMGYPKATQGNWRGVDWASVDAATSWQNGKLYLFKGGEYVRYDSQTFEVDAGYPKPIFSNWGGRDRTGMNWSNIDAALAWDNGKVYFFKDDEYLRYDIQTHQVDAGYPKPIQTNWGDFYWTDIDAAINWNNQKTYFFKGDQFVRYDMQTRRVDAGYPKKIKGNFPGF